MPAAMFWRSGLGCSRQPKIMPRQISEHWPTSEDRSGPLLVLGGLRVGASLFLSGAVTSSQNLRRKIGRTSALLSSTHVCTRADNKGRESQGLHLWTPEVFVPYFFFAAFFTAFFTAFFAAFLAGAFLAVFFLPPFSPPFTGPPFLSSEFFPVSVSGSTSLSSICSSPTNPSSVETPSRRRNGC